MPEQSHSPKIRPVLLVLAGPGLTLTACAAWYVLTFLPKELNQAARLVVWTAVALVGLLAFAAGLRALATAGRHLLEVAITGWTATQEARARTQTTALELRKLSAEVRKLEREAELTVVTAPQGHQVHISDLNPHTYWQARHLEARVYTNGPQTQRSPSPLELAVWQNWHNPRPATPPLLAQGSQNPLALATNLPERVDLADVLPGMRGSLKNIILGMRINERGQPCVVSAPMHRMCHIGVAGATDSGKSNFGRVVAYQVFTATEDVRVVVSDLKATTFKAFDHAPRLLYPIIYSTSEFMAVMAELHDELQRRKALFKPYPTVETLADYNRLSDAPLPVIVVFVDEVTNLFMSKETQDITLDMLREARAFGLYFTAMGQSWSHREMSPSIRQQFRTGLHFGTNDPASSRMIVNNSDAVKIVTPGRALASLPFGMGRGAVEIQTPYLNAETALTAMTSMNDAAEPTRLMPPIAPAEQVLTAEQDEQFRQLVEHGVSRRNAALEAYQKEYAGAIVTRGRRALGEI